MATKKTPNEEIFKEKPTIEELVAEKNQVEEDEAAKAAEALKAAEEEAANPEIEVDLDEEREKTKKETIEAVTKEVVEPLKQQILDLKKDLTPEEKDDYDKFVDDYTAKNGEAPQWKQVAEFLKAQAVKEIEAKQVEQERLTKEAEEATKKTEEETANQNFKVWQQQLQEIEDKELIPKMLKPEVGDPGFDARVKLYGLMQATWKSGNPSTNLWEVHSKFWKDEPKEKPGADAPVSMGQGGGTPEDDKDYKYNEIHAGAQDLEGFILKEFQKAGKA